MKINNKIQSEAESSHFRRINRQLLIGWMIIAAVLLVTYVIEVFKGERTISYVLIFVPVVVVPPVLVLISYLHKPDSQSLCYLIVPGYFVLYLFVMITGKTIMVSTYILPMLSLLVLCHRPKLILATGGAVVLVNLLSILQKVLNGQVTMANSDEREIQIALMVLCFLGTYFASRIYDDITKQNNGYLKILNDKNEQIQAMSLQSISTIANMIDAKDSYTEGHSQRVASYSVQLARKLGIDEKESENIHRIALLHDIGKIGVPDSILNKPGRLTDEEFVKMKEHTIIGSEIIKNVETIPGIYDGVRYHHERYDGRGYPDGLAGEDIPYVARIIAVADAFDAMTSNRVYRKHLPYDIVISELEKGTGTQFDPVVARVMIELLETRTLENHSPDMDITAAI